MTYGLTVPIDTISLRDHATVYSALADAGYTDVWSSEVSGSDAFTPLVAAATACPALRLGTAIVPAFTRAPALLAMTAASLADVARNEVLLGIGASSDIIVERWNGIPFHDPFGRVRDVADFLNRAFTGEPVNMEVPSFQIRGFRLTRIPAIRPKLLVAALRPGMLRLAGRCSDGAILNWLSPSDVSKVVPYVYEGRDTPPEIVARLFVIPSTDVNEVRAHAKRAIAAYLNVDVYAKFHAWLGRGALLDAMWTAWRSGDRKAAVAAVPDSLVDELFIYGNPDECRDRIAEYVKHGVTTPVLAVTNLGNIGVDLLTQLGPTGTHQAPAQQGSV